MTKYKICWKFNKYKGSSKSYTEEEWNKIGGRSVFEQIAFLKEIHGSKSHWLEKEIIDE